VHLLHFTEVVILFGTQKIHLQWDLEIISKILSKYEHMFKEKQQEVSSHLEKNLHQELDTLELLDDRGIKMYQIIIGAIQWAVTLRPFDVHTAVMTMSQF
jgi:hypothetical protein